MILKHVIRGFIYCGLSLLVPLTAATQSAAQTPAAEWAFSEGSGNTATDLYTPNHLAVLSKNIGWISGTSGPAVSADSQTKGYVTLPAVDLRQTHGVTVVLWTNRQYSNDGGVLFEAGSDYQSSTTGFALFPDDETCHGLRAVMRGSEGTTANCYDQPTSGVWHQLTVVYDKDQTAGDQISLYVDGALENPNWNLSSATSTNTFGNVPMYLFSRAGISQFGSGMLKDFRIYNTALTGQQVQTVYSQGRQSFDIGDNQNVSAGFGNFTITESPTSGTIAPGHQGTSTVTTAITGHFDSSISLSQTGAPSGTTITFNPATIAAPGSGHSTMTIVVGSNTPPGTYPITIIGTGDGIRHTTTYTLTVSAVATFTISASPSSLTIAQGSHGTSTITTAITTGFDSSISLSATGMPTGATISFNPNPIPAPGSGTSTMTVNVGSSTPTGTYPLAVTGTGGGVQQTTTVTLTVTGNGISLDGNVHGVHDNGTNWSNTAAVSVGTPTAGDLITCEVTFDSGNGNTLVSVVDNVNGSYAAAIPMHLDNNMTQWFGLYYIQNAVASPTTITLTTSQSRPYLAIACEGWTGVARSNSLDTTFGQLQDGVSLANPMTGTNKTPANNNELVVAAVGLQTSGAPTAGTYYSLIDGAPTTQWWPEYWVQTAATATAGNYTWQTDTWTDLMAAFLPLGTGTFTISASPASLTVSQGNQGASTITTAVSGGFNSSISLSASGVPSGTTVSFTPNPIPAPGSGSSTMNVSVGSGTTPGTYPITVTGTGNGTQQSTTVTLTVTGTAGFSLSASPSSLTLLQNTQGTSTITVSVSGGFNSSVSLSTSGVPSGTTVSFNPATLPAPGSGSSTMTITVGTTAEGTYPITVIGTGGGLRETTTLNLTVMAQVVLNWAASQSPGIAGYNVFRSTTSGGPYTQVNSSLDTTTTYNDTAVQDGVTYYYVTTAVDNEGQQSAYSNQASATVP